jgi:hypothetical protein
MRNVRVITLSLQDKKEAYDSFFDLFKVTMLSMKSLNV